MIYLNINVKGLNGRVHPALSGIVSTQSVQKSRAHIKMLCSDVYTYKLKSEYQGGSAHCRLCLDPNHDNTEDLVHILTQCSFYTEVRSRILFQMEIICNKALHEINFKSILSSDSLLTQFILDCTSLNLSTRININDDICPLIFNLARDLCYSILKKRTEAIKKLKNSTQ